MKPCTVPRIQPVGDDIARLTDTFGSGHRGQSRTRRAARDDRSVGGLLFADGVEANPAQHTVVVGRKPVAMHLDSGPRAADRATGTPAFRIRPRQWPGPPRDADTREAPPVALHRLRAWPRSRPHPQLVPQALVAICESLRTRTSCRSGGTAHARPPPGSPPDRLRGTWALAPTSRASEVSGKATL